MSIPANADAAELQGPAKSPTTVTSYLAFFLLTVLSGLALAGFLRVSSSQGQVTAFRASADLAQVAADATAQADRATLQLIARQSDFPDLGPLMLAIKMTDGGVANYMKSHTSKDSTQVRIRENVAALTSAWEGIAAAARTNQLDRARSIYLDQGVEERVNGLTNDLKAEVEKRNLLAAVLQQDVGQTTLSILILQIVTGLICIGAFFVASRQSSRDARARRQAVDASNASREQLSHLFAMTDMLQSASDLGDANELLRATAAKLMPGELSGALYVFSNSRDRLMLSTSWLRDDAVALPEQIGLQECWALKRGKAHINGDKTFTLCCQHHGKAECSLEIPMIARGEILGLLIIYAAGAEGEKRLEKARDIALALADAMSLALSNIALRDKLRSQALRDPLTGLYNRRYMEDALERTVLLADREKTAVSVIMIDLDNFKRLNDQYGHSKGDAVLRDTAAAIIGQLRETDIACRYGGEELLVVLPSCSLDVASAKAARLRASIESLSVPGGAQISASFGVASYPSTSMTTKELLLHADAALYDAKQQGRNRVVAYDGASPPLAPEPESFRLEAAE